MRPRSFWLIGLLMLGTIGGAVTLSLTSGQTQTPPPTTPAKSTPPVRPASATNRESGEVMPAVAVTPAGSRVVHDLDKMPPLTRQVHLSTQRGAEWLHRVDGSVAGRFLNGMVPALNVPLEGDHYLHQAGATLALARAARYFGDERYLLKARQAVLSLMAETRPDPADPACRCTTLPSLVVNRLAAAGMLLMIIHELPQPADDLIQQGEELANFIRKQQRADGSLHCTDNPDDPPATDLTDNARTYPGAALYGLMLSQRHRPAPWKTEFVRRALPFYRNWWKQHPHPDFVAWQSAAYGAAFSTTHDPACAAFVFEMNDWLCGFQYTQSDARHASWIGGFKGFADGKVLNSPPQANCAALAEGLIEACRVTRQAPDAARFDRYKAVLTQWTQFMGTLQYTEENTGHFAAHYRPVLMGGFHNSTQDGNLELEANQHAVSALVQYLVSVADR